MPATVVGLSAFTKQTSGTQTQIAIARALATGAIQVGDEMLLVLNAPNGGLAGATAAPTINGGRTWTMLHNGASNRGGIYVWQRTATAQDLTVANGGDADTFIIAYNLTTTSAPRIEGLLLVNRPGAGETIGWTIGSDAFVGTSTSSPFTSPACNGGVTGDLVIRIWQATNAITIGANHASLDWTNGGAYTATKLAEDALFGFSVSIASNPESAPGGSATQRSIPATNSSDGTNVTAPTTRAFTLVAAALGSVPPSVLTAPSIAGSASIGSTLTATSGSYGGNPTPSKTLQWKKDSAAIGGATAGTYLVTSSDAGHAFNVTETASNGIGSPVSADSNTINIPAAPANTSPPTATFPDGTTPSAWHTGDTVAFRIGAWTNATSWTMQVYQNTTAQSGLNQTGTGTEYDYVLQPADEGKAMKIGVIAHGPGGDSSEIFSAPFTPAVTAPLSAADIVFLYSNGIVGTNNNNTDPALSIGGARGATIVDGQLSSLFGPIPGNIAQAGGDYYAGIYIRNGHTVTTFPASKVYVPLQPTDSGGTPSTVVVEIAAPNEVAGTDLPVLASNTTRPAGVTFTSPGSFAAGQAFGDLGPGQRCGLWLHLHVPAGAAHDTSGAYFQIAIESDSV